MGYMNLLYLSRIFFRESETAAVSHGHIFEQAGADLIMKLQQLKYLLAIVDNGLNITAAAERLFTSQPGVSKQLKLLEEELGLQLFTRKGKSLRHNPRRRAGHRACQGRHAGGREYSQPRIGFLSR